MMGSENLKIGAFCSSKIWVLLLLVLSFWMNNMVESQGLNSGAVQLMTDFVNKKLVNITSVISQEISNEYKFCIIDPNDDWNHAFNFSSDLNFLVSCTEKYREDVTRRFCSVAEVKNYFGNLYGGKSKSNRNCNLTKWSSGCEPGWACAVPANQNFDLQDSKEIPPRTDDCNPCCEGFFCPRGLTCMIPCPLGSYCPLATLNQSTGTCQPYGYQLPTGLSNHTCGGADLWADVSKSPHMFCSKGSYCPTTTQSNPCDSGHYCRMGSTTEKRCFRLTDCNPNTETQNIHAYGVMLIAATITLLLIIYNCSDQVIAARERRLTKTREAAARSAKEMVKARQKWKVVRDAAKKHASGLQAHFSQSFSRSFSRKKVSKDPEELTILDRSEAETEYDLYPHGHLETVYSGTSTESLPSSETSKGREIESDAFKKVAFDIENASHNHEASDVDIGVAKVDGHPHKGKEISTHSQIFKYAYAQLEKEKAMLKENKNITFSGLVSMAANQEIRKRPPIEVSFKDLNVILKSKDKHLLRHVTGKFKPGRITAIMGPSGAGKTTFISALAGKAAGYRMTGSILINGRNDSIHSYRKTIGYVPQDDIVHGNLTVEENLWFNANCRLPADLSKVDKVLIVERVIEYLGLQLVRDSLVGTVEKRGISGGQRKRVNVGLEMVMEPSLLILDEPTSGLDSASSQLLLRALRHEALEGVNICMVVHQPSYALFQMFDDLVLLAKGGVTVYHGSAKKAEAYFAGLGIIVPDRVNPPDYFIDILEGMVEPSASSKVNYKELPVRWMLHKGYPVPEDMQQSAAILATPAARLDSEHGTASPSAEDRTFAGDLWQDVREKVEFHQDKIRHNFSKFHDLSHRRTPGIILQYRYFLVRVLKQRMREAKLQAVDYLILFLAGACLGSLASYSDSNFGFVSYSHTIIAVSLLCKIAALRTFSQEKLQYWRESSSGMSSLAYFLAKDTVDHFNTVIKPVVYLSMFYFFINPRSPLTDNYVVLLCLVYCVTGIAYVLSIFFQPGSAQLLSVLLPIVLTLIATQNPTGENKIMKNITRLCYPKWALEAFIIANAKRYYGVWLITRCGALKKGGYDVHDWTLCIAVLMIVGLASRGVAFLGMVTMKKK